MEELESTASRNAMTQVLAQLFKKTSAEEIDKVVYLLQGRVAPIFVSLEFGMADKMMLRAISKAYNKQVKEVLALFKKTGDLGKTAQQLSSNFNSPARVKNLSVEDVFVTLKKVAEKSGEGSVDEKVNLIADLLSGLNSLSVRFVSRIPVAKLRLGFSDMTVLDACSWMIDQTKNHRAQIEKAYNVRPDLGFIAKIIKEKGVKGTEFVNPKVFNPILMAKAERLSSSQEIFEKIGECAIEPKIDGFRLQVHFDGENVKLFTRNLEDATFMYPDVIKGVKDQIDKSQIILEGEAVAYDLHTKVFLPFQETVQRKRKYQIEQMSKDIPLKLICFEILFLNGRNLIHIPYKKRREILEKVVKRSGVLMTSSEIVAKNSDEIEVEFEKAASQGFEGIMAKRLDGTYQAGARSWNWIKYKRSYSGSLRDTIDGVVMGYFLGKGKRTGFGIGAFLIGIYDQKKENFVTVAKIGTGLTDEEWKLLRQRCNRLKTNKKPAVYSVDKLLEPDAWVEPQIVVEIGADEITRSPIHTAGRNMKPSKSGEAFEVDTPGFALRFPRLERFRDDKKPEDATSLEEIKKMFESQRRK